MADGVYRIGIVGASSLAGKELADELADSMFATASVTLFDDEGVTGQVAAAGDEISFIQRLDADSFNRMDFAFFTGSADVAKEQWTSARKAGASIVDLTYALDGQGAVLVRAPWIEEALTARAAGAAQPSGLNQPPHPKPLPDLNTPAVVAAHPAAVMLALVAARLQAALPVTCLAATLMEPASEYGRLAMDELHQQTVKLLSFQPLPKDQYDAQVAFNLLPSLGASAKVNLVRTKHRIEDHYQILSAGRLPELMLQLVHAPVFHGYTASVLLELGSETTAAAVEAALACAHVDIISADSEQAGQSDAPSNLSAAGQENILIQVSAETVPPQAATRFWLWLAADNLKLAAGNAVACALELRRLRPTGEIQ